MEKETYHVKVLPWHTAQGEKYYIFPWNSSPKGWKVSQRGKLESIFDQSSHVIYLTWYRLLLFFQEFASIILFMAWIQDSSQIKGSGYTFVPSIVC